MVVSHAPGLIDALQSRPDCRSILLDKQLGQTVLVDAGRWPPAWQWPAR